MPGDREYHIDDMTRTALQTQAGVRFLLRAKLKAESRHSSDVIPWAQNLSEKVTKAMAEAAGHQLTHFAIHLNAIKLQSRRPYALICYDLFLHESDKDLRSQFSQNPNQPIHEIIKRANSYYIIRSKRLDDMVASTYKHLQECDNGPPPYFEDTLHPPLYVDGRRIERPKDGTRHPDEPEGWDWERGWVFGPEEDKLKEDGDEVEK
ncbi:hypothetical protein MYCTH_2307016 [Thermothelomyces thermophilus ATCC 42464]|uniref:Uncharacterized protein n=1 Tax=Thermothelomyces thermophilus (strain ATCC 42464 / BCRC 31852 / DSM 1799) TaxID=573729 RepID=G2QF43_THET4|nr:uncharacterized protein MYCTH_2307016 [Thermothelomyces thermophilus ATCC 42464]AEO59072.1 hypothetical protein MYCTH_2307016 [Thermothelomyces thermophilus ATCC 42464]